MFNGEMIVIKRGQYLTSMVKLAEKWMWNRKTVSSYLNMLEKEQMITKSTDNKKTLITIENYEIYQCDDKENGQQIAQLNGQQDGQQMDSRADTNKNVKNDNNVNNNISSSLHSVVDAWNSLTEYGIKQVSKLTSGTKRYDSLVARLNQYGLDDVLKAIENIKHSDFLQGRSSGKRQWVITFDWFVLPNNFPKVLEGQYSNSGTSKPTTIDKDLDPQITAQLRALEEQQMASMPDVDSMSDEDIDKMIRGEL